MGVILSLSKDLGVTHSSHLIPGIIFMMSLFVPSLAHAVDDVDGSVKGSNLELINK